MKNLIVQQYREIADSSAKHSEFIAAPREGWLRTLRKALGMSGAQLAKRLKVSRSQVAQAEKNELSGAITLKSLEKMADAMGGKLVYAIVPRISTEDIIARQARLRAGQIIKRASTHMALEDQALSNEQLKFEFERLQQELLKEMPADLWDER